MQLAYETRSYILYVQFRQKDAISNVPQARFSNATVASNRSYASESAVNAVRENPQHNLTENDYSTVEENYAIGRNIIEAPPNHVKQINSAGYDLAKPTKKTDEDSNDYDHLEHIGLNNRPDRVHDLNDTYANAHTECFGSYATYSQAQRGQYFQTNFCTSAKNWQNDDTYEQARNIGCDDSDAYDHSQLSYHEGREQSSDNAFARAVTEGVYDDAAYDGNDIYE